MDEHDDWRKYNETAAGFPGHPVCIIRFPPLSAAQEKMLADILEREARPIDKTRKIR